MAKKVTIQKKITISFMVLISLIFIIVLSVFSVMNFYAVKRNIKNAKQNIRELIIAEGTTLVNNNSIALREMVEENAYVAIRTLISSTVTGDDDIVYGIYMDSSKLPLVGVTPENPSGMAHEILQLEDKISVWAASRKKMSYKQYKYNNDDVIEFVAPVETDGQIIGFIRYAISTVAMKKSIENATIHELRTRKQTMIVLLFFGFFSLTMSFYVARRLAGKITRPISKLVESAYAISNGDLGARNCVQSNDETAILSQAFNGMLNKIEFQINEIQQVSMERARLTAILEATSDLVTMVDPEMDIIYLNKAGRELLGWENKAPIDKKISKMHPLWLIETIEKVVIPTTIDKGIWWGETFISGPDGKEIPVSQVIMSHKSKEGHVEYISSIIRDISERKHLEERLRKANMDLEKRVKERTKELEQSNSQLYESMEMIKDTQTQLVESEKMASLGNLVAGVAHEVNTPIGIGVSAASFLSEKTDEFYNLYLADELTEEEFETFMKDSLETTSLLLKNLNQAADLVRSFKQVAVDQSCENRRTFKLKEYTDSVLQSLTPKIKNTSHTIVVNCPDSIKINSFPGAFSQIITNFVTNSIVHGFEGIEKGEMVFFFFFKGSELVFCYRDNGQGMSEDVVKKIFDPFFTTKRSLGGSGLGMHIVYNLVTQTLGGSIECDSVPGNGVAFIIRLKIS